MRKTTKGVKINTRTGGAYKARERRPRLTFSLQGVTRNTAIDTRARTDTARCVQLAYLKMCAPPANKKGAKPEVPMVGRLGGGGKGECNQAHQRRDDRTVVKMRGVASAASGGAGMNGQTTS